MKIKDVRTIILNIPTDEPVIRQALSTIGCVLVFLDIDEGITGFGTIGATTFGYSHGFRKGYS